MMQRLEANVGRESTCESLCLIWKSHKKIQRLRWRYSNDAGFFISSNYVTIKVIIQC
ncbi:hypothetical protein BDZ97DRAFT_1781272, partial [Flammula alnicola]